MHTFIAFLHHLCAFTVFACTLCAWVLWREPLTHSTARYLQRLERINTPAATLILVLGLLRVFLFDKGAAFYFTNPAFLCKLTLYGVASLQAYPLGQEIKRWARALAEGHAPDVPAAKLRTMRLLASSQLAYVIGMVFFAAWTARGGSL